MTCTYQSLEMINTVGNMKAFLLLQMVMLKRKINVKVGYIFGYTVLTFIYSFAFICERNCRFNKVVLEFVETLFQLVTSVLCETYQPLGSLWYLW